MIKRKNQKEADTSQNNAVSKKAADMHSFNKSDFDSNYAIVCFYHVCFYHLIINETSVNICSYSLATFHKKNAYLKIKALSI